MVSKQYVAEIGLKRDEVPSFENYPFSLAAMCALPTLELHPAVTFFVGEKSQFIIATHSPILFEP
jgi:predicted ATPase